MINERLTELYQYLDTLSRVQASGHFVNDEIKEVISEIRIELGLDNIQRKTVKDSRKLVFQAKLEERQNFKMRFIQQTVFDAVFNSKEKSILLQFLPEQTRELEVAVIVLEEMKAPAQFEFFIEKTPNGKRFVKVVKP